MSQDDSTPPIWDLYKRRSAGEILEYDDDAESENGVAWAAVPWDIRNESRPWTREEIQSRYLRMMMDLKDELSQGKLYNLEGTRMLVLGLLLENQGLDKAVRLGRIEDWELAIQRRREREAQSS
jgi:hypothetical protein